MTIRSRIPFSPITNALATALALTTAARHAAALNAFPGAEGFGAETTGARGSSYVYHVTSLSDANTSGTFRYGVTHNLGGSAGQTIVFDVGGLITMSAKITISVPNLTIAGQTAPGEGITLTGWDTYVGASNVSLRYMHFRPTDVNGPRNLATNNFQGDALSVFGSSTNTVTNVVLDHVSTSWSIDELMSATWCNKVTVQNCILAEALNDAGHDNGSGGTETHAYGSLIGNGNGSVTYAHNLYSSNRSRNPRVGSDYTLEFVNNVTYNWNGNDGYSGASSEGFTKLNYIANYGIAGPATASHASEVFSGGSTNTAIYQANNVIDSNKNGVLDGTNTNWAMFTGSYTQQAGPFASGPYAPQIDTALGAYNAILQSAGCSLSRDANDVRMVNNLINQTGAIIDSQTQVGFTTPSTVSRGAGYDTDRDGMPDTWESSHGLNPNLASDNTKLNPLGYTMLEQFLNESALASTLVRVSTSSSGEWNAAGKWSTSTPTQYEIASVQGNAGTPGLVTVTTSSPTCFQLFIGGNGGTAGEKVQLSGGTLTVVDTIYVGNTGPATLQLDAGSLKADNVQLGITNNGATYPGTLTMSGGTLNFRQIVLGAGTPSNWSTGGTFNWSGGTLQPLGTYLVNAPITLTNTATLNDNGYNGTFSGPLTGNGGLTKQGPGTLSLTANASLNGATTLAAGLTQLFGASNSLRTITGAGSLTLAGNKSLTSDAITLDTLTLSTGSSLTVRANGSSTSKLNNLTLSGSASSWTSRLDLTNNSLLLQTSPATKSAAIATLANQILSGKNGGNWTGNGITSSSNAADPTGNSTLALVDNADLAAASFAGQPADANTLIITRALIGDVNLDGNVDLADYDRWYKDVGTGTPFSYAAGDINLDGNIDLADYDLWYKHVGAAPLSFVSEAQAAPAPVPEPSALAILCAGTALLVARRKSRS